MILNFCEFKIFIEMYKRFMKFLDIIQNKLLISKLSIIIHKSLALFCLNNSTTKFHKIFVNTNQQYLIKSGNFS